MLQSGIVFRTLGTVVRCDYGIEESRGNRWSVISGEWEGGKGREGEGRGGKRRGEGYRISYAGRGIRPVCIRRTV